MQAVLNCDLPNALVNPIQSTPLRQLALPVSQRTGLLLGIRWKPIKHSESWLPSQPICMRDCQNSSALRRILTLGNSMACPRDSPRILPQCDTSVLTMMFVDQDFRSVLSYRGQVQGHFRSPRLIRVSHNLELCMWVLDPLTTCNICLKTFS